MKLISVVDAARNGMLPIAASTAYKWHGKCRYPKLIIKVSNKLFFDLDEWESMAKNV